MKARIKVTGEVVEVIPRYYNINGDPNLDRLYYLPEEVELIEDKEINWEQRTWDAAVAIMQAYITNEGDRTPMVQWAIKRAKELVAEYRKGE